MLSRRRLLRLALASTTFAAVGGRAGLAHAEKEHASTLKVSTRIIEVNRRAARVYGISQLDGSRGLYANKGERFRVRLVNELDTETLIHWHGLTPPSEQDGVPELSQPALQPGHSYDYDFVHNRSGTFWMHSHVGLQEQQLLAAPLIVRQPGEERRDETEVVVLLHDFSFRDPDEILRDLRQSGAMAMAGGEDMGRGQAEHGTSMGMVQADRGQAAHGTAMAMAPSGGDDGEPAHGSMLHFNDIEFDAYLANDRTLADPEVVRIDPSARVRLRIINGAAATNFLLDLGEIEGDLIAVDGNPILPVRGRLFDLAIAQRADIRLELPPGQGAYPILARREDGTARTGIVLATKEARVRHSSEHADHRVRPLDLDLEHRITAVAPLIERIADRSIVLDLTGSHAGYDWGLNEKAFNPDDPLYVAAGERVEVILRNRTAMPHPIHLHGHHFQVVAIDGKRFSGAVRDTVLVPSRRSVTFAFNADNPGHWAFHCHQLYHMAAGMMTSVRYEGYERSNG